MKTCNLCNKNKSMDDFYFGLSKDKKVKYYHAKCKRCEVKYNYSKENRTVIVHICFRCSKNFKARRGAKYCSKKCLYEGISDRMQFENELGIKRKNYHFGETY